MIYLRKAAKNAEAAASATPVVERASPKDLRAEGGTVSMEVDTPVALLPDGPFVPLGAALEKNGALRDMMVSEIAIPSLRFSIGKSVVFSYARVRTILLASVVVPFAMLLELDRELAFGNVGTRASPGRVIVDILLVAAVVFELSRRTPRMPKIAAIALIAIAFRWVLVATRLCNEHVHPLVYASAGIPIIAAIFLASRVPSRSRVALELLDKMGITRSELYAATTGAQQEPPGALVAAAVACAAGLPAILHLVRGLSASLFVQAAVFVAFGLLAPIAARRISLGSADRHKRAFVPLSFTPPQIMWGVAIGLALTSAVVTSGRLFFDVGAELARCVDRLDAEARFARGAEAAELARAVDSVRASLPLVIMTAAIFPFAEERIYRGLLQDVLARKYGSSYGVFAASLAFGVAHLGIYQVALYQTVLLGIGFGVAYAEGGLLAAFFVHATWNLMQLV